MWESRPATAADAQTWREGCPVGLDRLIVVAVAYWTFDGEAAMGELVINADIEGESREAFTRLFEIRFPLRSIRNIDEFAGSDDASMAADNTSGFNCRYAVADGDPQWSNHAYGRAIDINPVENPYVFHGEALPPEGAAYVDRTERPGMLVEGGAALQAFLDAGFFWGGVWRSSDYQHLEIEE
ncbi:MAG: M15 family metallopeptidase [Demequinaceae bacterium]|nr:M15 family metallopeptidase [Demequinaceae bacterium]